MITATVWGFAVTNVWLFLAVVAVFAMQGYQVYIYLGYQRMEAELDEYESKAIDRWSRPLLPLVYEQRARLNRAIAEQRVVLLINGVCCLAVLWAYLK